MKIIEEQDVQENLDRDMVDKFNVDLEENGAIANAKNITKVFFRPLESLIEKTSFVTTSHKFLYFKIIAHLISQT